MKHDVVVIGGGVIGASCAYSLAKRGAKVVLLEKKHFGAGASGCSAAMLECQTHAYRGDVFLSMAKRSLGLFSQLHKELKEATGIDFEYEQCGILNLAMSEEEAVFLKSCVESQRKNQLQAEWMEPEDIEKEFPQINPEYFGGAFYREDGQINGELFLEALLEGARKFGAELRENTGPVVLGPTRQGMRAVSTEGVYEADAYVVAAGAWADEVASRYCLSYITPVRGQLVFYSTSPNYLSSPVFTRSHGYVVPKRKGYTLVGSTAEDVGYDNSTTDEAMVDLIKKGQHLVPGLSRCDLRGISAGLRPKSRDDLPVIGAVPGRENIILAAGHFRNGMLLAPITGQLIASLVFNEQPAVNLAPFSPGRFNN
ncbi:MAG: Hydrogen cyanide synthase subunit HcnC [Elusimicrobia bacterium]|nr:Hydrogen cyanide synthase subunit HcnC [Elusimicrobiota bacterium]